MVLTSTTLRRLAAISCLYLVFALINCAFAASPTLSWEINGVEGEALENINALLTAEKETHQPLASKEQIESFYQGSKNNIRKALEPFGYFHSQITTRLTHVKNEWKIVATIHTGAIMKVKRVSIDITGPGKTNTHIQEAKTNFSLAPSSDFTTTAYEDAKDKLMTAINNQGYIKAFYTHKEVLLDIHSNTAVITITVDTSTQYYFGDITFDSTPYSDDFLKRFITLGHDDPFSSKKLLALQQSLEKSRYFQEVVLTPDYQHITNNRVPIRVSLSTQKAKKYNVGIGYGTLTGPRLTAGVEYRRVTDSGHAFSAQTRLSTTLNSLAAKYYIPGPQPLTDQYLLGITMQKFTPKNGSSESRALSAGFSKTLPHWQYNATINYLAERYTIEDKPSRRSDVLYPSLSASYNKTNDLFNPTKGYQLSATIQGAEKTLLSQTRFFQTDVKGKYLFSPTEKSHVILKGEIGYTIVSDLNSLPLSLRFFAGGPSSLRGYQDNSIGPGRYLTLTSAEFQHQVYGDWYVAIFHDIGNATDHYDEPMKQSSGLGIVYQSLIGPIKVYAARAHGDDKGPWRLQFSIGPDA